MKIEDIFRNNLNRLLNDKDKTQLELAKYIGVAPSTLNAYVKGFTMPRMNKIDKICEFFHVSREELLSAHDEDKESPELLLIARELNQLTPEQLESVKSVIKAYNDANKNND